LARSDVILHVDTLGLCTNAVIIGVGACFFELDSRDLEPSWYSSVDAASNGRYGRIVETQSLDWWRESDRYNDPYVGNLLPLPDALHGLTDFLKGETDFRDIRVWLWKWSIEGAILHSAYEQCEMPTPWDYFQCFEGRTLLQVAGLYGRDDLVIPSPYGDSPTQQMHNRIKAIRRTKRELGRCFDAAQSPEYVRERH
jgi:hypothetical protein